MLSVAYAEIENGYLESPAYESTNCLPITRLLSTEPILEGYVFAVQKYTINILNRRKE
jgi:hypothetical protein